MDKYTNFQPNIDLRKYETTITLKRSNQPDSEKHGEEKDRKLFMDK